MNKNILLAGVLLCCAPFVQAEERAMLVLDASGSMWGQIDGKAKIGKIVDGLTPKGKTPLSAAVKHAAEALKYTEEKATVILISDGVETCNLDPCALGTELEKLGVDFTAHVIGFDVAKVEDQKGLRCLAENTGGKFISAANAGELNGTKSVGLGYVREDAVENYKPMRFMLPEAAGTYVFKFEAAPDKKVMAELPIQIGGTQP
jgi:Ca-activated chloride channel family protein